MRLNWTSFSTTGAIGGGTNYSIQFTIRIQPAPPVPGEATSYRIDTLSIAGTKPDGFAFSVVPSLGETSARAIWFRPLPENQQTGIG